MDDRKKKRLWYILVYKTETQIGIKINRKEKRYEHSIFKCKK